MFSSVHRFIDADIDFHVGFTESAVTELAFIEFDERVLPKRFPMAILNRLTETDRAPVSFEIDGRSVTGLTGDTVLTAMLTNGERLGANEFTGQARAGFCLIGACQDCWVRTVDGAPLRACTTTLMPGMRIVTGGFVLDAGSWQRSEA